MTLRVVHFQRRPCVGLHSIEMLFDALRGALAAEAAGRAAVEKAVAPEYSQGLRPRLANVRWAAARQGDVNHVTGDVHFLALGLDGPRTVLTVHDCYALERLRGVRRWLLKRYWFDLPVERVAAVTAISEATRRELVRQVPAAEGKTVVIPNAVSPAFRPAPREFRTERPRILHIGTAVNKNLPRLAAALAGLPCELRIVGRLSAAQQGALAAAGVAYSAVQNLAEQEMVAEYEAADLVAFASLYEGFGMPIVEAQWVERPVVTSDCSSMPEAAGAGACLVDPTDAGSIRAGIARVMGEADYRAELIEAGRANRQRFALAAVARQYLELYEAVAAGASSRELPT